MKIPGLLAWLIFELAVFEVAVISYPIYSCGEHWGFLTAGANPGISSSPWKHCPFANMRAKPTLKKSKGLLKYNQNSPEGFRYNP